MVEKVDSPVPYAYRSLCATIDHSTEGYASDVDLPGRGLYDWKARKVDAEKTHNWITSLFKDSDLYFNEKGTATAWRLEERLAAEKDHRHDKNLLWPFVATAVFSCREVGTAQPRNAVCKVFLQIPNPENQQGATKPRPDLPDFVHNEIEALKAITNFGGDNAPGPRFLAAHSFTQSTAMWVTGGFGCMILMERVQGITLRFETFWAMSREERDQVRAAFAKSWQKLLDLGISHLDRALRNLIWDKTTSKCYIIDYESCIVRPPKIREPKKRFGPMWHSWGLSDNLRGEDTAP